MSIPEKSQLNQLRLSGKNFAHEIIADSCEKCNKTLDIKCVEVTRPSGKVGYHCDVLIENVVIGVAEGKTKTTALKVALTNAYTKLEKKQAVVTETTPRIANIISEKFQADTRKTVTLEMTSSTHTKTLRSTTVPPNTVCLKNSPGTTSTTTTTNQIKELIPGLTLYLPYPGCMSLEEDVHSIIQKSCVKLKCTMMIVPNSRCATSYISLAS